MQVNSSFPQDSHFLLHLFSGGGMGLGGRGGGGGVRRDAEAVAVTRAPAGPGDSAAVGWLVVSS